MSSEVDPLEWEASPGSRPAALITRCPMKHSAEGARMYIYIYIYIYLHLLLRPLGGVNGLQHALRKSTPKVRGDRCLIPRPPGW